MAVVCCLSSWKQEQTVGMGGDVRIECELDATSHVCFCYCSQTS